MKNTVSKKFIGKSRILYIGVLTLLFAFLLPIRGTAATEALALSVDSFGPTNTSGVSGSTLLRTTGSAFTTGGVLRLTPNTGGNGTAVRRNTIKLTDGFSTYFQIKIDQYISQRGDGMAFIVYKGDTVLEGGTGGGMGYAGIPNSYIVEFDTYQNTDFGDPYDYHFGIMKDGDTVHTAQPYMSYSSLYGNVINAWVDYDGSTGIMTAVLGTSTDRSNVGNKTLTRNVGTALVGQNVYVGFSAATGGARENHDVLKWYFKNSYVAGGLSSTAGTYVQSAATAGITLDSDSAPTAATIRLYDASGAAMAGTADVYVDDVLQATDMTVEATGYTYSFTGLTRGSHTLRAVATGGSSALKAFTLQANPPSVGDQPDAQSVTAGNTATFTTAATSTDSGTIAYQWQVYGGSSWSNIPSATGASYTTGTLTGADHGKQYRCFITNTSSGQSATVYTNAVSLSVSRITGALSITGNPAKTFDGSVVSDPSVSTNSGGSVVYVYFTDNGGSIGTLLNDKPSGAGTYWVVATVAQTDSHTQATGMSSFTIGKKTLTESMVGSIAGQTYSGSALTPSCTVADGSTLAAGDYAISYSNNTQAGTATATIVATAGGNYTGSITRTFSIGKKTLTESMVGSMAGQIYSGSALTPSCTVADGSILAAGDYVISYSNNTQAGTATATIVATAGGNYTGSITRTFSIGKKTLTEAMVGTIPDQIYSGSYLAPVVGISDGSPSVIGSGDYTISYSNHRVVGTATATIAATDGGNYTGSITRTFTIGKKPLAASMVGSIGNLNYTGEELRPAISLVDGTIESLDLDDFEISYANNREVGTAMVTITGISSPTHTGTLSISFGIVGTPIGGVVKLPTASVKLGDKLVGDLSGITPALAKTSLTYQWYRNGSSISGATLSTYTVGPADEGKTLTLRVNGGGFFGGSLISNGVGVDLLVLDIQYTTGVVEYATADTPKVTALGLDTLFELPAIYTPKDIQWVSDGGTVKISLVAALQKTDELSSEDRERISEAAGGRSIGLYLDLTIAKILYDRGGGEVESSLLSDTGNYIDILVPIPEELRDKGDLWIYRLHEGEVEALRLQEGDADSDGEYYVMGDEMVRLHVRRFSIYAFGYGEIAKVERDSFPWWILLGGGLGLALGSILGVRMVRSRKVGEK